MNKVVCQRLDVRNIAAAFSGSAWRGWVSRLVLACRRLGVIGRILPSHDLDPALSMAMVQSPLYNRSCQLTPSELQRL